MSCLEYFAMLVFQEEVSKWLPVSGWKQFDLQADFDS